MTLSFSPFCSLTYLSLAICFSCSLSYHLILSHHLGLALTLIPSITLGLCIASNFATNFSYQCETNPSLGMLMIPTFIQSFRLHLVQRYYVCYSFMLFDVSTFDIWSTKICNRYCIWTFHKFSMHL